MSGAVAETLMRWAVIAALTSIVGIVATIVTRGRLGPVILELARPQERRWLPNRALLPQVTIALFWGVAVLLRNEVNPLVSGCPVVIAPALYRRRKTAVRATGLQWSISEVAWRDVESVGWLADGFVVETRDRGRTRPSRTYVWALNPAELASARAVIGQYCQSAPEPVRQLEVTDSS